ncbi:MAG: serine--tRNA ligase [Actinomycetota bacterium]|nr:serine--tRNA ligase [Actinomycetota bacterium]
MIDIDLFRKSPEIFREEIKKRNMKIDIDKDIEFDAARRKLIAEVDELRALKNENSKRMPKLSGEEREQAISEMKKINERLGIMEKDLLDKNEEFNLRLSNYPNISHESTPVGKDENDNVPISFFGDKREFDFEIKNHIELGKSLDILDDEKGAQLSGARFVYLKNEAVFLEFALINYVLKILYSKGFSPVIPPVLVKERAMYGTGFLPAEKNQYYKIESDELYLVGTAEVPLCSYHADDVLEAESLPMKYCGFSTCFRREAGSYGKDMGGMFRVHQFDKIEMFIFSNPENSWDNYEFLRDTLEEIFKGLKLHYRILNMCTGDIGSPNAKKYDLEAWLPGQGAYRELASCSNDTDYQSRRLNIKYKDSNNNKGFVHTMNSTACAVGRTLIAIYENYQDYKGNIRIPEVLIPYMNGIEIISSKQK